MTKLKEIFHELKEHLPFTIIASFLSVAIISFFLLNRTFINYTIPFFYVFHPVHLFFSSIASTAILYNHKKNILFSISLGVLISILVCTVSDVLFPYFGALFFGVPISFHLPEMEIPLLILGVAIAGGLAGIIFRESKFPHFIHVFISVFASLFYIFAYASDFSILNLFFISIITSVSVVIPCCLSDIVFPMLFLGRRKHDSN